MRRRRPRIERRIGGAVVLGARADADAEHDAAAGQHVERRDLLGDQHGAVCSGRTTTVKAIRTRSVTAAAAESVTMISGLGKVMRSPAARVRERPGVDAARTTRARAAVEAGHHHRQIHADLHGAACRTERRPERSGARARRETSPIRPERGSPDPLGAHRAPERVAIRGERRATTLVESRTSRGFNNTSLARISHKHPRGGCAGVVRERRAPREGRRRLISAPRARRAGRRRPRRGAAQNLDARVPR